MVWGWKVGIPPFGTPEDSQSQVSHPWFNRDGRFAVLGTFEQPQPHTAQTIPSTGLKPLLTILTTNSMTLNKLSQSGLMTHHLGEHMRQQPDRTPVPGHTPVTRITFLCLSSYIRITATPIINPRARPSKITEKTEGSQPQSTSFSAAGVAIPLQMCFVDLPSLLYILILPRILALNEIYHPLVEPASSLHASKPTARLRSLKGALNA